MSVAISFRILSWFRVQGLGLRADAYSDAITAELA